MCAYDSAIALITKQHYQASPGRMWRNAKMIFVFAVEFKLRSASPKKAADLRFFFFIDVLVISCRMRGQKCDNEISKKLQYRVGQKLLISYKSFAIKSPTKLTQLGVFATSSTLFSFDSLKVSYKAAQKLWTVGWRKVFDGFSLNHDLWHVNQRMRSMKRVSVIKLRLHW